MDSINIENSERLVITKLTIKKENNIFNISSIECATADIKEINENIGDLLEVLKNPSAQNSHDLIDKKLKSIINLYNYRNISKIDDNTQVYGIDFNGDDKDTIFFSRWYNSFESTFNECEIKINNRKQKKEIRGNIQTMFIYWKKINIIADYKEKKEGTEYIGIEFKISKKGNDTTEKG